MSGRVCVITGTGVSMGRETGVDVVVDGGDARLVIRSPHTSVAQPAAGASSTNTPMHRSEGATK
jgi:hypothetical protein